MNSGDFNKVRGYEAHLDLTDTFTLSEGASFKEMYAVWTPWTGKGIEHLHLMQNDTGIVVDSLVVGTKDEQSFRLQYCLRCDKDWKVRACIVRRFGAHAQELKLQVDGQGHWVNVADVALPTLDGCIDVDISATPFTNTLPIRRLALRPGQSADILAVYIAVPEMEARPMKQRYTCLEGRNDGGLYRYENLTSGFVTEMRVDAQGLVLDYPEHWRRSWDESFIGIHKPHNHAE